jgi:predicted nucleotidyltransferase
MMDQETYTPVSGNSESMSQRSKPYSIIPTAVKREVSRREKDVKRMIQEVLERNDKLLKGHCIVLFGSRARGDARRNSDFDIGVVGENSLPLSIFFEMEDQLKALPTLYKIDWVDLNKASHRLKEQALKEAEVLYG